ncbi:hypothetical protein AB1K81_10690 [Ornithinibacillus sp. 179-J 7C1 HS]
MVPRVHANMVKKITFINKKHSEVFTAFDDKSNYVHFYKIEENLYGKKIFSKHSFDRLKELITETNKANRKDVRNINLPENFAYSFTLCEKFDGARYPDSYEDLPNDGWHIQTLDSYKEVFEVPIEFELTNN